MEEEQQSLNHGFMALIKQIADLQAKETARLTWLMESYGRLLAMFSSEISEDHPPTLSPEIQARAAAEIAELERLFDQSGAGDASL